MKKNLTLLIILSFTIIIPLKAQDDNLLSKGRRVAGGGLSLNFSDNDFEPDGFGSFEE